MIQPEKTTTNSESALYGEKTLISVRNEQHGRFIDCGEESGFICINSDEQQILIGSEALVYFNECQLLSIEQQVLKLRLLDGQLLIRFNIPDRLNTEVTEFVKRINELLTANK